MNIFNIYKIALAIVICISSTKLNAQIKNIDKIISGDYKSIKENKIKTIFLKSDNYIINEININSSKNELIVSNKDNSIHYFLTETGNPINIIIDGSSFFIDYFDNNSVKKITRTSLNGYSVQSTYFSDPKNLKTIHNKRIIQSNDEDIIEVKHQSYIYNIPNPALSYLEKKGGTMLFRKYDNGAKVIQIKKNDSQSIDSTFIENNKSRRYYHFAKGDKDSVVIEKDTIITQIHKHKKLVYESGYLNSNIIFSKFYDNGVLERQKQYLYLPYYENKEATIEKGITLWEIKTTFKNKKNKQEFPQKKYFRLRNGKLIENKKNKLGYIVNTSDMLYKEINYKSFPRYILISQSILSGNTFLQSIQNLVEIFGENEMNYCRYDFQQEKCIFQIGEDFDIPKNQMARILSRRIQPKNYKIEIVTEDNKIFVYNLNDYISTVFPVVDLISIKEE